MNGLKGVMLVFVGMEREAGPATRLHIEGRRGGVKMSSLNAMVVCEPTVENVMYCVRDQLTG